MQYTFPRKSNIQNDVIKQLSRKMDIFTSQKKKHEKKMFKSLVAREDENENNYHVMPVKWHFLKVWQSSKLVRI